MRQHHTKIHGEPLPNRTCKDCEVTFYDPKSRRSYCDDCNPNAGPNNGNWTAAKENTQCNYCGDTFEFYPSNKDGHYCGSCVTAANGLLPENASEPGPRLTVSCEYCDANLERRPKQVAENEHGAFCDQNCFGEWLSTNVVGPDHHQWQGGPNSYSGRWWLVRRQALQRDNHRCQQCGVPAESLGKNPDVHHIVPVREYDDQQAAHRLSNVVTLCRSCHRNVESGNIPVPSNEK